MKVLSVAEVREADRRCIEELGIPGPVLMNNAGSAVFRELQTGPVIVICGKGNNGGDGFVVARLALVAGWKAKVLLVSQLSSVRGDAEIFLKAFLRVGGEVKICLDGETLKKELEEFGDEGTIVDALLGTGTQGEVVGLYRSAIECMNGAGKKIVAVDLPSGLNADTGEPCGVCVKAYKTVTFQFVKKGFLNPSAKEYLGELVVADIGIPEVCADDEKWFRLKEMNKKWFER
ncbi:MAG: NAD(P)H-hydrate epimerase [Candidatus Hydrogenedentes bacterium]|nr:NAD(P)H-hydrate epimerase [Candidatus Hydrogenedentota bacterium]